MAKLFVHFIATTTNCDRQRIYHTAQCLSDVYDDIETYIEYKTYVPQTRNIAGEVKIAVFQRVAFTDDTVVQKFKQAGYIVAIDMDDDPRYFDIHKDTNFNTYRLVDAVIVSSASLYRFISQFNPNCFIFENHLGYIPTYKPKNKTPLKFFFGAFNREKEYEDIIPALNRLADKHDLHFEVVNDSKFYQSLTTPNKKYTPHVPYPVYLSLLGSCHFALLPLRDTEFNRCKTDLKFLECASQSVIAIASPTVYGATIHHEHTGIIYRSPEEFEKSLGNLITDEPLREKITLNAYQYVVLTRHIRKNIFQYRVILEKICTSAQG